MSATAATPTIRALIAEDEALLAQALRHSLQRLWPALEILDIASNGIAAVQQTLSQLPDILFLDIKMPGQSGLDAAREIADEWPQQHPFPAIVFVTAYDQYAVQAFEQAAFDYLLKPVNDARLSKTIARLQNHLAQTTTREAELDLAVQRLSALSAPTNTSPTNPTPAEPLRLIRATVGNQVRLIPIEDVVYFEATDKYVNVVTPDSQSLIRTSLKELLPQLNPAQFWQIHRGTIVQISQVQAAQRNEAGKLSLSLHSRPETLTVSRLFAHLFRPM